MAATRPLVSVRSAKTGEVTTSVPLPGVYQAPIRRDVVQFVHSLMSSNHRQPYAVSEYAGMQHSAVSWGTGRAVARIPRVSGSGTHRAGEGAFGNMCRKGRMFAPTRTWRRWNRKINVNQRRYATVSAVAASGVPALVMARGHKIDGIEEIPLVVSGIEDIRKTKEAIALLATVGAGADADRSRESKKLRCGVGKSRNRRYVLKRGPLIVCSGKGEVARAFRNLPGVDVANVDRLNLLELAPGGHVGRFIIWSADAFNKLDGLFGTSTTKSAVKNDYSIPRAPIANADIARIINSQEVQAVLKPKESSRKRVAKKKNPLTNLGAMVKLNPYALVARRTELVNEKKRNESKGKKVEKARKFGKNAARKATAAKFITKMKTDSWA